jgi:hypothetical protein
MFAVEGKNHTSLLQEPEDDLVDLVVKFLNVSSDSQYEDWRAQSSAWNAPALEKMKQDNHGHHDGWQQFVIHVVDEYGDPVPDYVVDLFRKNPTGLEGQEMQAAEVEEFDLDVHSYQPDQSYRCFHVRIPPNASRDGFGELWMRLTASSGTELIAYQGYTPGSTTITEESPVILDISHLDGGKESLFHPFTTTLVEIKLNREPLPFRGQTKLMAMRPYAGPLP